jgi:hypothetical protein
MLNSKPFSFIADCKALEATIKKVVGVLSSSVSPSFFILGSKKKTSVIGMSGDTFVMASLADTKADAEGAFCFAPDILTGLIKNRKDMEFAFNGNECNFKQVKGPYKGHIVTLPITGDQQSTCDTFLTGSKKIDATIPAEVLLLLKAGLNATNVKDVYQGSTLLSFISLDKKGQLSVSSFDSQHFGMFKLDSGVKGLQFKAALPASHFSLIDQVSAGEDAKFSITNGSIRVEGKSFIIVLPATQAEESHYEMVENFVAGLSKPVFRCGYDAAQLSTLSENLFTLYNANTAFVLSAKDAATILNISFTTPSGTASDSMKVQPAKASKAFKASVDPRLFKDILFLARTIKEPELSVTDKVVIMQGSTSEEAALFLACARSE